MNKRSQKQKNYSPPFVKIEKGPQDWQILQQNEEGTADVKLSGSWELCRIRKKPNVTVRIVNEGSYSAISNEHDWKEAKTVVPDRCVRRSVTFLDLLVNDFPSDEEILVNA